MKQITVLSPAKLNLYLDVLDKRPDGYHNIQTLFERIDLCDEITIKKISKGIKIRSDSESLPVGHDNLMYKAVGEFSNFLGRGPGVEIFIKKKIPISSGLGGGSSNAASVLSALGRLYDLEIDKQTLFSIGRGLGADVGFFLTDYIYAIGRGKGDELEKVDSRLVLWQVLIRPKIFISTAEMYRRLESSCTDVLAPLDKEICLTGLTHRNSDVKLIKKVVEESDIISLGKRLFNIFEGPLLREEHSVKKAKELLNQSGSIGVSLSGSGPTVFGIFRNGEESTAVKEKIYSQGLDWDVFVTKTFNTNFHESKPNYHEFVRK